MSIPRTAIHRPVMMFMISAVIILLGAISLTRLPVDLMPEISYPSITVRVSYSGVGPLEMEEIVTRPLEQAVAAVAGLERISATSSEGSSTVRLNFVWGTDLNEAADDVRTRIDRVRGRLPEDADAPTIFKFDSSAQPIMGIGVEGDFDRGDAARDRRARAVAAHGARAGRGRGDHQRRPAPADPRAAVEGEDRGARSRRSTASSASCARRTRTRPLGLVDEGDMTYLLRSQGQFAEPRADPQPGRPHPPERARLPARHRRGEGLDRGRPVGDADQRQARRPDAGHQAVGREHRQGGRRPCARRSQRINQSVPGIKLLILDDSSVYIEQSISAVQEHAMLGAILVILDHLRVPAQRPLDADHLHVDPDLRHRHLRAALLHRLHAQHA